MFGVNCEGPIVRSSVSLYQTATSETVCVLIKVRISVKLASVDDFRGIKS